MMYIIHIATDSKKSDSTMSEGCLFNKWCQVSWTLIWKIRMDLDPYFLPYKKINSR